MNKSNHITVYAPATIANVGPGFDILGLAIDAPGDIVTAKRTSTPGLSFTLQNPESNVPNDHHNIAAYVATRLLDDCLPGFGVIMTLQKNMPIQSGLGSSSASCAAAVMAVNSLLDNPLSKYDLIRYAAMGEKIASGSAHADNVAPALLGGLCLIRSYHPLDVIQLPYVNNYYWIVAHPALTIATSQARNILPKSLPLQAVVIQMGNLAGMITGLQQGNNKLIQDSLNDVIAEPVRAALIPGYEAIKQAALDAGAIGFSISGSGPSVFAVSDSIESANLIGQEIQLAFKTFGKVNCQIYISKINPEGAKIIENNHELY